MDPSSVDGRIAQLCAQAKAEENAKKEFKAGQLAPAEYADAQCTELEVDLREAVKGEDTEWLKDPKADTAWQWGPDAEEPEAAERERQLEQLAARDDVAALGIVSDHLHSHLLAHLLLAPATPVEQILLNATAEGCRDLAEEATRLLEATNSKVGNLGQTPDVIIGDITWEQERKVGRGTVSALGVCWRCMDF